MAVKALNQEVQFKIIVLFHSSSDSVSLLPSHQCNGAYGASSAIRAIVRLLTGWVPGKIPEKIPEKTEMLTNGPV